MIALFLFLFPTPNQAQASESNAEWSGRWRWDQDFFLAPQKNPVQQAPANFTFELEEKSQLSDHNRFLFEPRLHLSSASQIVNTNFDGDFRDTQWDYKIGHLHTQIGSFIKEWEGTDITNPMDIATMKSYRDPFNSESLGSWGVFLAGENQASTFNWEFFYVPFQTAPRLPGDNSPWLPRKTDLQLASGNEELLLPANPTYDVLSSQDQDGALKNNFGLRFQLHQESLDFSLAAFEGAAQLPILQPIIQGTLVQTNPKTIVQMDNPIRIQPIEYRRRTVAGAVTSTQESWIFRLAARYDQPLISNPELASWSDQVVAGVEKTISFSDQNLILTLLYSHKWQDESSDQGIIANPDPFTRALILGVRASLREDLVLSAGVIKDTRNSSFFTRTNLQKRLNDHWTAEATADWGQGPSDSLFGLWQNENRFRLSLIEQF